MTAYFITNSYQHIVISIIVKLWGTMPVNMSLLPGHASN